MPEVNFFSLFNKSNNHVKAQSPYFLHFSFAIGLVLTVALYLLGAPSSLVIECGYEWILAYLIGRFFFLKKGIQFKTFWAVDLFVTFLVSIAPFIETLETSNIIGFAQGLQIAQDVFQLGVVVFIFLWLNGKSRQFTYLGEMDDTMAGTDGVRPDVGGLKSNDIDEPIELIKKRSLSAASMMKASLFVILTIVLLGGGASIGTEALSEFSSTRQLQIQRNTMIELANKIKSDNKQKITDFIQKHYSDTYEKTLNELKEESALSWERIAMKATIAILTLFLVQVFFNIYKYNQQQFSYLSSKIETIELFRETTTEKESLRQGMLDKMESPPTFDKDPTAPTEKIINILENVKK